MSRAFEETRNTYTALRMLLKSMKFALATGDTVSFFESYRCLRTLIDMVSEFAERKMDEFSDFQYDDTNYELECISNEAEALLGQYKEKVA